MSGPRPPAYAFGDDRAAADRLDLLAEVFGPTSAALLREHAPPAPGLAVDLGCGPGHTTRLLGQVSGATRTIGLDRSPAFLGRAGATAPPGVEFALHDVTVTPFPARPAEVVFARYLLAHLPDPLGVAARWAAELTDGGRLILEEVEHIDTSLPTFARYLQLVTAMLAARDTDLHVGRSLATWVPGGTAVRSSRGVEVAPATGTVARLFSMNLHAWRDDLWIRDHVDPAELASLATRLRELERRSTYGEIVWTHRQVVYVRR